MATGKMSFNYYQNGKYGALPNSASKDMEITQDMHLKMSKKIAQLTKVCCSLIILITETLNTHLMWCMSRDSR